MVKAWLQHKNHSHFSACRQSRICIQGVCTRHADTPGQKLNQNQWITGWRRPWTLALSRNGRSAPRQQPRGFGLGAFAKPSPSPPHPPSQRFRKDSFLGVPVVWTSDVDSCVCWNVVQGNVKIWLIDNYGPFMDCGQILILIMMFSRGGLSFLSFKAVSKASQIRKLAPRLTNIMKHLF